MGIQVRKAARSAGTAVSQLSEKIGLVAVVFLVFMMMLTVTDVFLRYVFNRPIAATMDYTEYMMLVVVLFALSWCALQGSHVKVDLIVSRFSFKAQGIFNVLNYLLVIAVSALLSVQAFRGSFLVRRVGDASEVTGIPDYPFYFIVTAGFILMCLVAITLLIHSIYKMVRE